MRHVIVCTENRGVYFGQTDDPHFSENVTLHNARCCIYWGTTGGVFQLARTGPTASSRIGDTASMVCLRGAQTVIECTALAANAFKALPQSDGAVL